MRSIAMIAAVAAIVGSASLAQAQSFAPEVPNPANPAPENPYATNGTPLPYYRVPAEPHVFAGRSAGYGYYGPDGYVVAPPYGAVDPYIDDY